MGRVMGTVKFFDAEKKYGIIIGDDDKKYLFMQRDILRKSKHVKAKDRVLFGTVKDARGTRAIEVRVVGS